MSYLSELEWLESESIHILREVAAEFTRPCMLYSVGKDSSVMLRLAQKAFAPAPIPFCLLHVDTTYKFPEMITFRDQTCAGLGVDLVVHVPDAAAQGVAPFRVGTRKCCAALKTRALLDALVAGGFDAAIGGARRDEEGSRAKERIYSFRNARGLWDPRRQRPEIWDLFNGRIDKGENIRVFPLSNWTELDVWEYIQLEQIPVVPLYFAAERPVVVREGTMIPWERDLPLLPGERPEKVMCRMRSLGCTYCTGAIRSTATTIEQIIEELRAARRSERENRVIDHDQSGSMEIKKSEGYF